MPNTTPEDRARIARENGAKSKGPKTPEGKVRSSMNGIKHGLYSQKFAHLNPHLAITCQENEEGFDTLMAELFRAYNPVGTIAETIVRDIAMARWQIDRHHMSLTMSWNVAYDEAARRPLAIDTEVALVELTARTATALFSGPAIAARINREIARLHRLIANLHRELRFVQKNFPAPVEPTERTVEINEANPVPADSEPPIVITEADPIVIAAYQNQFPGRRILVLPPDNVAKGIDDEDDDGPQIPRRTM